MLATMSLYITQPTQKFRAGLRAAEAAQSGEKSKTIVAMPNAVNVVQRRGARKTLVVKVESAMVSTSSVENYGAAMMLATMSLYITHPTQKFRAGLRAAEAAQSGETSKTIVAMPNAVNMVQRRGARKTLVVKVESAVVSTSSVENYGAAMMLATMSLYITPLPKPL